MNKSVIHIFGASGSGTTTLAGAIRDELNYTLMDTDDYYWLPTEPSFTAKRDIPERLELLRADIAATDRAVISGSLVDWGDELIPLFTLAIRVVTDTSVRLERIKARERARFGSRLDEGGDMHDAHIAFLDWAAAYDTGGVEMRSKAKHDEWQRLLKCDVITVNGADDMKRNMDIVRAALGITLP